MKKLMLIVLLIFSFLIGISQSIGQISIINTGTTDDLASISVIKKNILIAGHKHFIAKSYDECNTLIPMSYPSSLNGNYLLGVNRIDTNVLYLNANSTNWNFTIWKSNNGGNTWTKKFDTLGNNLEPVLTEFFDTLNGIFICYNFKTITTLNGLNSWSIGNWTSNYPTCSESFGDSTIILGSSSGPTGVIIISKNRGQTWDHVAGSARIVDFEFLNKDTIFGLTDYSIKSYGTCFLRSFNGGINWDCVEFWGNPAGIVPPDEAFSKIICKRNNEIYMLARGGRTSNGFVGNALIMKSTNLGKNWSTFKTPFKEYLYDMKFLNDSIALVCGSNGLLFKWNTKSALFTTVNDINTNNVFYTIVLYPNPAIDFLNIQSKSPELTLADIEIINLVGKRVYKQKNIALQQANTINISDLNNGVYFVRLTMGQNSFTQKVVINR